MGVIEMWRGFCQGGDGAVRKLFSGVYYIELNWNSIFMCSSRIFFFFGRGVLLKCGEDFVRASTEQRRRTVPDEVAGM